MIILNKANQYLNVVKHQFLFLFNTISFYLQHGLESTSFATKKEPLHTPTFAGKEINLQLISKKDFFIISHFLIHPNKLSLPRFVPRTSD